MWVLVLALIFKWSVSKPTLRKLHESLAWDFLALEEKIH